MKRLLSFFLLLLVCRSALAQMPPCSSNPSFGTLTMGCTATRTTGISPLLVFIDCTGTTAGVLVGRGQTVAQDVSFQYSFGDPNASGTGTWAYGANPNGNSKNQQYGGIVGVHLYVLPVTGTTDLTATVMVNAYDGANTGRCTLSITVYAPSGTNGYPGANTICAFNSTQGSGCPSGASTVTTSTFSTATASLTAAKRVLLKCGDSFSGTSTLITNGGSSLGAYGSCAGVLPTAGTTGNYPATGQVNIDTQAADVRVSDLYITGASPSVRGANNYIPPYSLLSQITLWNLYSASTNESYYLVQCTQCGYIQLTQIGMGANQGTYPNFGEDNCTSGSAVYPCSGGFVNIDFNAVIGGSYDGTGGSGVSSVETIRISACRKCIISNNLVKNGYNGGAVLKLHPGNTKNSSAEWIGQYMEFMEVSDNFFTGASGAQLVELCPQNGNYDERIRNSVIERNVASQATGSGVKGFAISGTNITFRNNMCGPGVSICASFAMRGSEWTSCTASACAGGTQSTAPVDSSAPELNEAYNNTCAAGPDCIHFETWGNNGASFGFNGENNNSDLINNLYYKSGGSGTGNSNGGTGNTVSNNTTNGGTSPGFTNGTGNYTQRSDYTPTVPAAVSGASSTVSNWFDACVFSWNGAQQLGAHGPNCQ